MKKILFYAVDTTTLNKYRELCNQFDIQVVEIGDSNLAMTLQEAFALEKDQQAAKSDLPYMFMQELELEEVSNVVRSFREAKLAFEGIKVMRTENNSSLTIKEVMEETKKEHILVQKLTVLQKMLEICNRVDMSVMKDEEKEEFKHAVVEAYMVLKSGEYQEEMVDHALNRLKDVFIHLNIHETY